ncbi:zinc-binding dehydrogenase [Nocardia aurantia]|uniref:Alcohol dehydrogenase n=1 Tax=Nocardia aurantia TaxID=2585199 RepID=A0A7K0DJF5_9NOCA|nr:zinc-binding dehydrogenase [Nocardia aurantia]MQY25946.1 alcohol dehydrogenase [Nocardia aurantia]
MKAVTIREFGSPGGLAVVDRPAPVAAPGQVLLDVEAIGVGGVDAVIRRGTLGGYGFEPGLVPGSEVAGVVTGVGEGVDPAWLGRRVWAFTGLGGGYAEQAVAAVADAVPLPRGLSGADAVTLGSSGPVAHFGLAHARFASGESVLVRGAAGSIGIAAVQLAARAGAAAVAVTTSSAGRGDRLRALGATHVLDRAGAGAGPAAYDVVFDVIGGPDLPAFLERLAPNGRMVVVGAVGGLPPADFGLPLLRDFRKSLSVATFSTDTVPAADRDPVRAAQFEAAARGELRTVIHEVLPLDDAALAHRKMDEGEVFGRIVLTP